MIVSRLADLDAGWNWTRWRVCGSDEHVAIAVFLLGFLFFSALALCPGFYFRLHYFILVLPAVSLLAGVGHQQIVRSQRRSIDRSSIYPHS